MRVQIAIVDGACGSKLLAYAAHGVESLAYTAHAVAKPCKIVCFASVDGACGSKVLV